MAASLEITELTDGGQPAASVADQLAGFIGAARRSLDIALYDVRLEGAIGEQIAGALRGARDRGVSVRIAYNADGLWEIPVPPPPSTRPELLDELGVALKPIPGEPDLMHHKYVVRDGEAVWCGSTNWTIDSWTREENVIVTLRSRGVAAAYERDFAELWRRGRVESTGRFDTQPAHIGQALVRPWFSPGRGEELAHRIAKRVGTARSRVRIASPVLTSGPILATLAEVCAERRIDVLGVCDWTQLSAVFGQWRGNPGSAWKMPLLAGVLETAQFNGKHSTPYAPGATHNYMHAKIVVADDVSFVGSFNLSRSGEMNAENVLEIADPAIAERLAAFVERIRARYPDVTPPEIAGAHRARGPGPR